jgi:spermidine synthase
MANHPPHQNQKSPLKWFALLLGGTSVIAQILLLRELVTVFYGNETAYAIILASWLFWIAAGSYTINLLAGRIQNPLAWIGAIQWGIYFILPATIILTRHMKQFMHVQTGEIVGIIPMCVASYLLLAPLTVCLGAFFTLICLYSDREGKGCDSHGSMEAIGNIYLWESVGATLGGLLFSFILLRLLPAMHIALGVGAVNLGAGLFLCQGGGLRRRRAAGQAVGLAFLFLTVAAFLTGFIAEVDRWSRRVQWKGLQVVAVTDSIYGNIAMIRTGREYSLYENGLLSYTTQDSLTSEESVHFPLLEHPSPGHVLLVGNGVAGALEEILKHPSVRGVDYVELDPKVIEVSKVYLPGEYLLPLEDERVRVRYADARWLVKRVSLEKNDRTFYDVVVINLSDPYTALINRYYTFEFFREVNAILNAGGILALKVSSSENYLHEEARAFLRSIQTTLQAVFPDVKSIPGDTNIFLACNRDGILTQDSHILLKRLKERRLETKYIREYYLPFKLSADRIFYIEEALRQGGTLNRDTRPIAYLYDIVLWSTHFNSAFKNFFMKIRGVTFYHLLFFPVLVLGIGLILRRFSPTSAVTLSLMTTGFSEIIFQLIVILAFQTLYGYAYYKIGLIIASFMGGLVAGSLAARRIIADRPQDIPGIYKIAQAVICLYPLLLPLVFAFFRDAAVLQRFAGAFASVFACLPVIAGFIGGLQYPLATHLLYRLRSSKRTGKEGGDLMAAQPAGFLYAADVLGATMGAFLTGMLLIPLWGVPAVAVLCAVLNAAVFVLLYPLR